MKNYMGIDIGGTNIKGALVTSKGEIIRQHSLPTDSREGSSTVIDNICRCISVLGPEGAASIGLGCPGPLDPVTGVVIHTPNLPLKNTPLRQIVAKKFRLPVYLDNDANCFILGEATFGAGIGLANVVGITLGTGIGSGAYLNGIYRGRGSGMEFGHTTIDYLGPAGKCNNNCIEELLSARGIMRMARQRELSADSPKQINILAKKGNPEAVALWRYYGITLGIAITNLVNIFDPDLVVIGGRIANAWPFFGRSLKETVLKRSILRPPKIARTKLGIRAGILGAAAMGMRTI
ncbi:MAG: ROK family protein [archaeon]